MSAGQNAALVARIIHHSVVDGPGNRAAVFLQGCNYHCSYCHNPETISVCCGCGTCVSMCPAGAISISDGRVIWDDEACTGCDTCIHVCPHLSSPRVRCLTAEQVMEEIRGDIPFIRGITVSGGECTLQRDFLVDLFTLAKEHKLTALLDSNGSYDYMADAELMNLCDGVMLDVKAFNTAVHKELTGRGSEPVIENARKLMAAGKLTEIRTVIVPGVLPSEETIAGIADVLKEFPGYETLRYKLIAYRNLGVREPYNTLFRSPSPEEMQDLKAFAEQKGFRNIVVI